jgi:mannose/fructose/N-acetylgalactosamine-specific phosphotransferase system component IIB
MIVQDLVNALLQFPATMEVYTVREDFSKMIERYSPVESVTIGEAAIKQDKDKEGNDVSIFKQAILIKGLTLKENSNG